MMWENGSTLANRWQLIEPIGQGTFSTVWKAMDTKTGEYVAVKCISICRSLEIAKRVLRELLMLKHFKGRDHILQIIGAVCLASSKSPIEEVAIVSELLQTDLGAASQSNRFDMDSILLIIYQILAGVQDIHKANTLHRDLKPTNILLNFDLVTKICDFGMGRGKGGALNLRMTQINNVATPSYRAPDGMLNIANSAIDDSQPSSSSVSHYTTAVDIWACGCILAELIIGEPLFKGADNSILLHEFVRLLGSPDRSILERIPQSTDLNRLRDLMEKYAHDPTAPELRNRLQNAPEEVIGLCLSMLRFDPLERISASGALRLPMFSIFEEPSSEDVSQMTDLSLDSTLDLSSCTKLIQETVASLDDSIVDL